MITIYFLFSNMRYSQQKEVILNLIYSTESHPTVNWIYNNARTQIPNISLGTVYRNLKQLEKDKLIMTIFDGNIARYDSNMEQHDHLKCNICGDLIDINKNNIDISKTILRNFNFKVTDIEMTISGTCKKHT
tara:strand:- start:1263 stop:1658 length:396 start_codon:yes stop_codon:yes gene_type:complete